MNDKTPQVLPYDVEAIRADFPILHQDHSPSKPLVYLDNAASSQRPSQVIDAISDYYQRYHANVHRGIHKLSEEATAAYEGVRPKVKRFINAGSKLEIVFTHGTTESINLVAQTWGRANLKPGDVVLSTQMEHHANIVPWQMLAAQIGFELQYIPITPNGMLDLQQYEQMLNNHRVKLVVFTHGSNVLGTINPAKEIIHLAHSAGAITLVDSAQTVPHMPVDVQDLDADFFAFSGHKMLGPTGTGVLYGKRTLLEIMPPWMGGGDMISQVTFEGSSWNELPYKFEAGTPHIAGVIGLGYAIDYLEGVGMVNIHEHGQILTEYAMDRLQEIPGIHIYGPESSKRGSLTAFRCEGIHPHDMAQILDSEGVAVRAGHHCAQPLHTCLAVNATTRASFYLYTTFAEVDALVNAIYKAQRIFSGLRRT